ncbi:hypothetical protein BamMEX5DRAFT_2677 [Burkholderia ambifaria MEX-5]|uniref:Uncharacterized protein n=1 Tax=Burkholderia ambifaria MEX-5 TaxID=396597 RepID=B1T4G1_9BURK|nr:hypothetical protein BamMEX5DRAFT_2677 [Burkholderia ambifaria MEX-5]
MCVVDRSWCTRTRRVEQAIEPMQHVAPAPLRDSLLRDPQFRRDRLIVDAFGAGQHDPRSQRQRLRSLTPHRQSCELIALRFAQHKFRLRSSTHRRLVVFVHSPNTTTGGNLFNEFITHDTSVPEKPLTREPVLGLVAIGVCTSKTVVAVTLRPIHPRRASIQTRQQRAQRTLSSQTCGTLSRGVTAPADPTRQGHAQDFSTHCVPPTSGIFFPTSGADLLSNHRKCSLMRERYGWPRSADENCLQFHDDSCRARTSIRRSL